jgi:hypothetical protein
MGEYSPFMHSSDYCDDDGNIDGGKLDDAKMCSGYVHDAACVY